MSEDRYARSQLRAVHRNPDYDTHVDPKYYQQEALRQGGLLVARKLGEVLQEVLPLGTHDTTPPTILDIAAGTGIITRHLKDLGYTVTATDMSRNALEYLKEQDPSIPVEQGDMNERLPFGDESFDGATTMWANRFIHVDEFLNEAYRVLRPDGVLVWPIATSEYLVWKTVTRRMGQPALSSTLRKHLEKAGFTSVSVKKVRRSPLEFIRHFGMHYPSRYLIAKK